VEAHRRLAKEAASLFEQGDFAAMIRFLSERFTDEALSLHSVFRDEQHRIVGIILQPMLEAAEASYRHLYEEHILMIRFLASIGFPLPPWLSLAAQVALDLELGRALSDEEFDAVRVRAVLHEAELSGVSFEPARLALIAQQALERFVGDFEANPEDAETLERLQAGVGLLPALPFAVDTRRVQTTFLRTGQSLQGGDEELRKHLGALAEALRVRI